jgi:phosphoribosylanthranilate isomerase
MRQLPEPRPVVGLVVNEDAASMASLVERTGVDVLQLSGDESPDLLATLAVPVVKSIRLRRGQSLDSARQAIEPWFEHRRPVAVVLLDAHVEGQYGGTGHVADWDLAAALAEWYPVMLAGGLTVSNVGEAIRRVRPRGVDVSSGVETDGTKDHAKIRAFIVAARSETSVPSGD